MIGVLSRYSLVNLAVVGMYSFPLHEFRKSGNPYTYHGRRRVYYEVACQANIERQIAEEACLSGSRIDCVSPTYMELELEDLPKQGGLPGSPTSHSLRRPDAVHTAGYNKD